MRKAKLCLGEGANAAASGRADRDKWSKVRFQTGAATTIRIGRAPADSPGALNWLIFKIFAVELECRTTTFWMFVGEATFGCARSTGQRSCAPLADLLSSYSRGNA